MNGVFPEYCPFCGHNATEAAIIRDGHSAHQCHKCPECGEKFRIQRPTEKVTFQ